jgi:enterochelin esterase-like enzyme
VRRALPLVAALVAVLGGAAASNAGPNAMLVGTIAFGSFHSAALRRTDHFSIYLPPGYATSTKRYPVVYFLHGLPAPADAYKGITPIAQAVEAAGKQAIVVGAQGSLNDDTDPEWRDWGPGRDWETATGVELVRAIDSRYRTIPARAGRLLIGISAGGYGATLIADHLPGTFTAVESWSGYFQATDPTGTSILDLGSQAANDWANFEKQIPQLRARLGRWFTSTYYGFYVGSNDDRFLDTNEKIDRELRTYKIPNVRFQIYDGGHSWSLWQEHAADWVGAALDFAARVRG